MTLNEINELAEKQLGRYSVAHPSSKKVARQTIQLCAALKLALYYVEGDATYEGLVQKIKDQFGLDAK